ncbi:hypothetical protein BDN72DRAFT_837399 [Pluteus cervinus]|uniref:Uncharacterized protein n=1 Tax=Pluteus cervinus TaxID=181527 RepID=A0ACD3B121_9AGAR|nr:hypothetical protein BDN72DRAFT_837399 [Pluteus cervinus]
MADDEQTRPVLDPRPNPPTPPSPPSPGPPQLDTKLSRKREREVSLEPATTPVAVSDVDPLAREYKAPAKKNRVHLDATEEEEDIIPRSRSNSRSPPLSVSPPQEIKIRVRQISQGVEDLSWRNLKPIPSEEDIVLSDPVPLPHGQPQASSTHTISAEAEATTAVVEDSPMPSSLPEEQPPEKTPPTISQTPQDPPQAEPLASLSRRGSDSDSGEKGVKRKFTERGTSQGPQEDDVAPKPTGEALKRQRDDSDVDDNPREPKRPSPPPPDEQPSQSAATPAGGFAVYAATISPFGSVKGQNVFSSNKSSGSTPPPPRSQSLTPANPFIQYIASSGEASTSTSGSGTPNKRTGFEAFTSSSPFTAAIRSKSPGLTSPSKLNRNKSPPRRTNSAASNAFTSYLSSGVHSFAVPVPKRARGGSPSGSSRSSLERNTIVGFGGTNGAEIGNDDDRDDRPTSFGERLRSTKDAEDEEETQKVILTEQDLTTGEEEEQTIHQVRGKLFSLDDKNWREKGSGLLKLNVRREDGHGARLVMRKDAVYTVILNVALFPGMHCSAAQDPRFVRFAVFEDSQTVHYGVKVANAKIAEELLEVINGNIPLP